MAYDANDPSFRPLEASRVQELELNINRAAQTGAVLEIDPDTGVQGVRSASGLFREDGTLGVAGLGRHFGQNA